MLIEELVLGDVCRDLSKLPIEVMMIGYYEIHRIWLVLDEIKARDLSHLHMVMDASQSTEDYRKQVWEWLQGRQPRRHPPSEPMPQEVLDHISKVFKDEGLV